MIRPFHTLSILLLSSSAFALEKEQLLSYISDVESVNGPKAAEFITLQHEGHFDQAYRLGCEKFQDTMSPFELRKMYKFSVKSVKNLSAVKLQSSNLVVNVEFPLGIAQFTFSSAGAENKMIYHFIGVDVENNCVWSSSSRFLISDITFK